MVNHWQLLVNLVNLAIGELMTGKTLAANGEKITNAMIDNDILAYYW